MTFAVIVLPFQGKTVSESLKQAWTQVRSVEHMSSPDSWASFVHVGFDTTVNLTTLRHQLFDNKLDQVVQSSSPERFPLVTAETLDNKGNSNNNLILPILE